MSLFEAIILGLLQGLTEFLPVSSSGHLELAKALLGIEPTGSLTFSIFVHAATVLSIIVVFWKDLVEIFKGLFAFKWNWETQFSFKIALSMIPVGIVGVLWKEPLEAFFEGNILLVGFMLLLTALILFLTRYAPKEGHQVTWGNALIIGIAQAIAVTPGISRSGSTIGAALLLGVDKERATRFSFLMVLVPILGATLLEAKDIAEAPGGFWDANGVALAAGFVAAFLAGVFACRWMLKIVREGNLIWFAGYCLVIGLVAVGTSLFL